MKYIAIGDIHGCGNTLVNLLNKLDHYQDRTFVFIGDYIDRGPKSRLVLDTCMEFAKKHECVFLRGNHEVLMLDAFQTGFQGNWTRNGGLQTMISLQIKSVVNPIPEPYFSFVEDTQLFYDTPDYFFVHAGLNPGKTIAEAIQSKDADDFLWSREHIRASERNWEKTVVFGHTPVPEPIMTKDMIGIDTGCVYHHIPDMGKLTAVLLPEREIIQEPFAEY